MDEWEHRQNWRAHSDVWERIQTKVARAKSTLGPPPRKLRSGVIFSRFKINDGLVMQVYVPGFAVAGQGRCVCDASLEALFAYEGIIDSVEANSDWGMLPEPDRSITVWFEVVKTRLYLYLGHLLEARFPSEEVLAAADLQATFAAAP